MERRNAIYRVNEKKNKDQSDEVECYDPLDDVLKAFDMFTSEDDNEENQTNMDEDIYDKLKSSYENFSTFYNDWSDMTVKEKAKVRDNINFRTLMSQATELPEGVEYLKNLTRGTFFIGRVLWDPEGRNYHDHLCFVDQVDEQSLTVIFITDIFEDDDKPKIKTYQLEYLNEEKEKGKLKIVVFNFGGLNDNDDLVLKRAKGYKVPVKEVRALHFAYTCAFGLKEPIYSKEHLSLCPENTILLLRSQKGDKVVVLKTVEKGVFHILKDSTEEMMLSFKDLINLTEASACAIYYYPNIKADKIGGLGHDVAHSTLEVGGIHLAEHGVKELAEHGADHGVEHAAKEGLALLAPELLASFSHALGGAIHGVIASITAGIATNRARKKEKKAKSSCGLKGISRTRGNKEVITAWSKAAVGTGASLAGTIGGGALVGQLSIPVPGLGMAIGAVAGGVVASITAAYVTNKVSKQVYDINIESQCPLGDCH